MTIDVAGGDNDLSLALLGGSIGAVHFTADATLTLTADQVELIGVENFTADDGVTVTLNIVDLDAQSLDLDMIADAGISIGTVTIANTDAMVTLDAETTLGGAAEIITPTWDSEDATPGVEDTKLTMTAEQFNSSAGVITGEAEVFITDLMNNRDGDDDDLLPDYAAIDLSGVTAPNGTITLGEATVTLAGDAAPEGAASLAGFTVLLGSGEMIRFSTEAQAPTKVQAIGAPTAVAWLFETITGSIDLGTVSDFVYSADPNNNTLITTLFIAEELVESMPGGNEEDIWSFLPGAIVVEKVTDGEFPDVLVPVDRTNTFQALANIDSLSFDDLNPLQTITDLTLNLEGQVVIGELLIGDTAIADGEEALFSSLTVNSYEDRSTLEGTSFNSENYVLLPNEIGDIGLIAGTRDELIDITLSTADGFVDQENVNGGTELRDGLALVTGTISLATGGDVAPSETPTLTLTGDHDITIGAVDISDPDITIAVVDASGMGLDGTDPDAPVLLIGGENPENLLANLDTITLVDGHVVARSYRSGDASSRRHRWRWK